MGIIVLVKELENICADQIHIFINFKHAGKLRIGHLNCSLVIRVNYRVWRGFNEVPIPCFAFGKLFFNLSLPGHWHEPTFHILQLSLRRLRSASLVPNRVVVTIYMSDAVDNFVYIVEVEGFLPTGLDLYEIAGVYQVRKSYRTIVNEVFRCVT